MLISLACSVPACFKKYLEFFEKNKINFCISGGYSVYRAGFCSTYTDVDIFIDNFNFNEKLFLELDHGIQVILNEKYVNVGASLIKRFAVTVMDSETERYQLDFVLMDSGEKIENNYLFSEYVTGAFDIDVSRVSIINIDEEYRLVLNSHFKVFISSETKQYKNYYDEQKMSVTTFNRFMKYESRMKSCYRLFPTNCAPPFDFELLMKFHQFNLDFKPSSPSDQGCCYPGIRCWFNIR